MAKFASVIRADLDPLMLIFRKCVKPLLYCKNLNSHCEIEWRIQEDVDVRILALGFLTNELLLLTNARNLIFIRKVGLRGLLMKNCRCKSVKSVLLDEKPITG